MSDSSHGDEARRALAADKILHARDYAKREGFLLSTSCFSYEEATMIAAALRADPVRAVEEKPSPGLLMSMALRYDHGLGMPGYYDQEIFKLTGGASHARRLESTLSTMRQLWEEVKGSGFYKPEEEAAYAARLAKARALPIQPAAEGGAE